MANGLPPRFTFLICLEVRPLAAMFAFLLLTLASCCSPITTRPRIPLVGLLAIGVFVVREVFNFLASPGVGLGDGITVGAAGVLEILP